MIPNEVQAALVALGYSVAVDGNIGPKTREAIKDFQKRHDLKVDGHAGPLTIARLHEALAAAKPAPAIPEPGDIVPAQWMPAGRLERVICHWTAGQHRASDLDRSHYHILIEGQGGLVRGDSPISANGIGGTGKRASHTLNCNTGSIGVSLCCMAGAKEQPFDPGKAPMTAVQWERLVRVVADLCRRYGIPVTPRTVLSHAEVQANLGIKQRGKWDFTRLAFAPSVKGAKACGDLLRAGVSASLAA
ncbi:N-acetylmuramoyl-L-alanine amidase [Bosea sp. Root483D1]|uniref:peptidoglycan recognition protein family protein n=1 Tax=Bosea sp. Root483D1 TaxID=1736544 RepID=UPI00070FFE43|nr:peptidoglycan-binding protein [Bosea sp. Root483D1]KRE15676.1 N-acetylmuramoyl-L-alanine amidase [Bosea sp. Root483D1]